MPKTTAKQGPDPIDVHVGAQVRQRREELGLNQTELARALGLTFQQVQKYEKGSNRISASKLYAIAERLDVPVAWFFPERGAATQAPTVPEAERQVLSAVRRFVAGFAAEAAFMVTTSSKGPLLTMAVLHKDDHEEGHLRHVKGRRTTVPGTVTRAEAVQ